MNIHYPPHSWGFLFIWAHDGGYIITSSSKVSGWNHDIVLMKTDSDGNISGLFE